MPPAGRRACRTGASFTSNTRASTCPAALNGTRQGDRSPQASLHLHPPHCVDDDIAVGVVVRDRDRACFGEAEFPDAAEMLVDRGLLALVHACLGGSVGVLDADGHVGGTVRVLDPRDLHLVDAGGGQGGGEGGGGLAVAGVVVVKAAVVDSAGE